MDYLYMIHDLKELDCPELDEEFANMLESFDRLPSCGTEHRTALRLFRARLIELVRDSRETSREHSEAAAEALRERVEDE